MSNDAAATLNTFIEHYKLPRLDAEALSKTIVVNTGDVLTRQGEQQEFGYLIHRGILRAMHYGEDGAESCKEYYFNDELSFLYAPWIMSTVADFQIEALTEAVVLILPLSLLSRDGCQHAKIKLLQQQLLYKEAKEAFFLLHNPQQRYAYMLEHFPQWIAQLNNQQIAAYIGISPVSLSRIKNR